MYSKQILDTVSHTIPYFAGDAANDAKVAIVFVRLAYCTLLCWPARGPSQLALTSAERPNQFQMLSAVGLS